VAKIGRALVFALRRQGSRTHPGGDRPRASASVELGAMSGAFGGNPLAPALALRAGTYPGLGGAPQCEMKVRKAVFSGGAPIWDQDLRQLDMSTALVFLCAPKAAADPTPGFIATEPARSQCMTGTFRDDLPRISSACRTRLQPWAAKRWRARSRSLSSRSGPSVLPDATSVGGLSAQT
jgi:hypothetical protein